MEIIIGIVVIWFIWRLIKFKLDSKNIINILNELRIDALKNPSLYSVGSDLNSISQEEAEERIGGLIVLALKADGYNILKHLRNIELRLTFNSTVSDIYNMLKKESMENDARRIIKELAQEKSKGKPAPYKPYEPPVIDINEDEIPF